MELTFTWETDPTSHRAGAEILPSGDKALEILANLLVDDGGTSTEHSIQWIDTGIERMQSVALGQVDVADWARESLGFHCDRTKARIYFLVDENYWVEMNPLTLITVLTVWRDFLSGGPTDELGNANSMTVPLGEKAVLLLDESVW